MSDQCVFRTTNKKVIAVWDGALASLREYEAEVEKLEAEHPGYQVIVESMFGRKQAVGLSGSGLPNENWRKTKWFYVPLCKMKPGKEMSIRLSQITWSRPDFPGMDGGFLHGFQYVSAGVERIDDAVVVQWPLGADVIKGMPWFDGKVWKAMRLSEFYALKESVDGKTAIKVP